MPNKWDVTFKVRQRSGKDRTLISSKTAGAAFNKGLRMYLEKFGYKREDIEWVTVFPQGEEHA